ncbi:class I SAM-dependent rRNA methyltransferase [Xanthomonadaceae bacterium JHOS43]|nr:class I SAM-dependent rRNA methyltransferase [Xanthomonadaceae bacterium JHOS43]
MTDQTLPVLQLKRGEDRRLRAGHLWVFSNEIDVTRTPLTHFAPGDAVSIVDAGGKSLGTGYVNPSTLIAARLLDRGGHPLDRSLIVHRLNVALALRERLYPDAPFYRLVFGESDGLPGLVLDRFGDIIVGQTTTAGMERLKPEIAEAVEKVLSPSALVWKNDGGARALEALPSEVTVAFGEVTGPLRVEEGGYRFDVDATGGQKTGWFYDQRANRDQLAPYVRGGAKVLDLFSYVGAWGVRAAGFGASEVTCVDASAQAVEAVRHNAALNHLSNRIEAVCDDAFEFLRKARAERRRWDVVIADPPAFVKRRKDFREGSLAYRRINTMAMQVLERDGILVSCSCSHHMARDSFLDAINAGARHLDRQVQVLQALRQGPDHPVQAAIPETDYLKGFICRVLPA